MVVSMVPALLVAAAPAGAATGDPQHVSITLQGCRNNGSIVLPNSSGQFICPDAAYTSGNLGPGWNELDLVPFRITNSAGTSAPATQTYTISIAVDNMDAGHPGYDVLSAPVLNTALSSSSCTAAVSAPDASHVAATLTPGVGGTDSSLYRKLTITQNQGTTCVYDYYARLALGSHLYPGSSLHANLLDQNLATSGIGAQDVPIPVKAILPQQLTKDMTASQASDHMWNVVKQPSPATVSFANTCDASQATTASVQVTVTWTKFAATPSGPITVITHVYATNPASRPITVNAQDVIYSGTNALDLYTNPPVTVPANTMELLFTHTITVPSGTSNLNDVATATYTDAATGIAVPGNTQATASATVQNNGPETNGSAVITDVESMTGSNLTFSVDSTTGASGTFSGGYTLGTATTGPVTWVSSTQTDSGSVTFNKTVYATAATVSSGALSDIATLNGSDGFTTTGSASIAVTTNATTSLNVSKTTALQLASPETFTFHLYDASTNTATGDTATVTIPARSNGPETSSTITGLSPTGSYYFKEDANAPYPAQTTSTVTFQLVAGDLSTCSAQISVVNQNSPAIAQVRKDTVPASSGLWTFTLTGPNGLSETKTNVQAGGGYVPFASPLAVDGGTYTITETPQTGYDLTNIVGDVNGNAGRVTTDNNSLSCSFTLNLTTDAGGVFECTFTNTQRGQIIVKKVTNPSGATQLFTFDSSYGAQFQLSDGQSNDSGLIKPGTYSVSEESATGWDLTGATCDNGDSPSNITLLAGATVTCTFTNTERGQIVVKKVTNPSGATQLFTFNPSYESSFQLSDGGSNTSGLLVPGSYSVSEAPTTGWDLTGATCDNGNSPSSITLGAGQTVTCTFTNTERGHVKVVKTVSGAPLSGSQSFTFQLRQGASPTNNGTTLESGVANAADGGVINFATLLVPGTTYALCELMMPGWNTSLQSAFLIYNPGGDTLYECTDFTVTPGQTLVFNVDNTPPPGGLALTIGFWKNWASCAASNGNHKPVLDQTLLAAANAGQPITIGLLVLNPNTLGASTACKDAVALLNKSTLTGTKKASDPLFNMAAQLLGAELNVQAGAGTCSAVTTAINQAQALLVKYHFNGNTYSPKLTAADAALANQLATTLDNYNNNRLC